MSGLPHEALTQAEFTAWEQRRPEKHEFVDGHVYGFADGTQAHNEIAAELLTIVRPNVRPCRALGSDMLIEMTSGSRYADVVVTGDERDVDPTGLVVRFPKLIIEVLSESTVKDDLGPKMREYQTIETMQEYLAIDSRKRWAQVARRGSGASWVLDAPLYGGILELHAAAVSTL